jgi:hypothetical protein
MPSLEIVIGVLFTVVVFVVCYLVVNFFVNR